MPLSGNRPPAYRSRLEPLSIDAAVFRLTGYSATAIATHRLARIRPSVPGNPDSARCQTSFQSEYPAGFHVPNRRRPVCRRSRTRCIGIWSFGTMVVTGPAFRAPPHGMGTLCGQAPQGLVDTELVGRQLRALYAGRNFL